MFGPGVLTVTTVLQDFLTNYSLRTKIHIDQLNHGIRQIGVTFANGSVRFPLGRQVARFENTTKSIYLQFFRIPHECYRLDENGLQIVQGRYDVYAGQSIDAWSRHPDAEGHKLYVQVFDYSRFTDFDKDTTEMGAIAFCRYLKSIGFVDNCTNTSHYAIPFQFYLTLDIPGNWTVPERSIGFKMTIFGVVIDVDIGKVDADKERWIGKGVKALIENAKKPRNATVPQEKLTIVGTSPPESLVGKPIRVEDVPLLVQLFGNQVNFLDQFPDLVSTTHGDFCVAEPEKQVAYDEAMLKSVKSNPLVVFYGSRNTIAGRTARHTDERFMDSAGTLVLDNGFGDDEEHLWYHMTHGGYDAHYAPGELRTELLPEMRFFDLVSIAWIQNQVLSRKETGVTVDYIKSSYDDSTLRWLVQKLGEQVTKEQGFTREVDKNVSQFAQIYAIAKQGLEKDKPKAFKDLIKSTSDMKSVNRYLYYCNQVEKTFGKMKPFEKSQVYGMVKKLDAWSSALTRMGLTLSELEKLVGVKVDVDLLKTMTSLLTGEKGPDGIEKRDRVIQLLKDPKASKVQVKKNASRAGSKMGKEAYAKVQQKRRLDHLTPYQKFIRTKHEEGGEYGDEDFKAWAEEWGKTVKQIKKALENQRTTRGSRPASSSTGVLEQTGDESGSEEEGSDVDELEDDELAVSSERESSVDELDYDELDMTSDSSVDELETESDRQARIERKLKRVKGGKVVKKGKNRKMKEIVKRSK